MRILVEGAREPLVHPLRQLVVELRRRLEFAHREGGQDERQRVAGERDLPGEALVGHHGQRPHVDLLVGLRALGGDEIAGEVLGRADERARLGQLLAVALGVFGDAEVEHLGEQLAVNLGDEDVLRLDVAVNDPELVRRRESAAHMDPT